MRKACVDWSSSSVLAGGEGEQDADERGGKSPLYMVDFAQVLANIEIAVLHGDMEFVLLLLCIDGAVPPFPFTEGEEVR
nr:hypothetical protein Iba_chr14aCG12350 [Ipomoea batatas]